MDKSGGSFTGMNFNTQITGVDDKDWGRSYYYVYLPGAGDNRKPEPGIERLGRIG
jgi:hypothetical protein